MPEKTYPVRKGMPPAIAKSIPAFLLIIMACHSVSLAKENSKLSNLDRAVVFAVSLEARASRLENRADVCVGLGHGLAVHEKEILFELRRGGLRVHPNDWCNQGPRGLVISIIAPTSESVPSTYDLVVQVDDLQPIRQGDEHFANLLRRGTYSIRCKGSSDPVLVRYQEATEHTAG